MADIIQVLPDAVANQIAAGEVIQRPASVVKELMENAVDAGADHIQLIVKEAGKVLIQVIDNGSGMSESDARLCFERHATSKIHSADDLFDLYTFGFRGEAMASIAAVAQVILKTKSSAMEIGTCLRIEGSTFIEQEPCQANNGTNIRVNNLFYNVPARRKFLKSNNAELRHIIEEFQRVAIVHPEIEFIFHQNDKLVFQLPKTTLKDRIVSIFNKNYVHRLVNFDLDSTQAKVKGFVTKPEFAKKKRGEQYFFVNGRFFKHNYFHHAVMQAFDGLIQKDFYPSYFIFLEVDPKDLDINIHPTKTEINFSDQQYLYAMLRSSIQESLGRFNIAPALDFKSETPFDYAPPNKGQAIQIPKVSVDPTFNPFEQGKNKNTASSYDTSFTKKDIPHNWEKLYEGLENIEAVRSGEQTSHLIIPAEDPKDPATSQGSDTFIQIHLKYILTAVKSGMMIVDQHRAHYRIRYEEVVSSMEQSKASSQTLMFSTSIQLTPEENTIFQTIRKPLTDLGFVFEDFGPGAYQFTALPTGLQESKLETLIHQMINTISFQEKELEMDFHKELAKSLTKYTALKTGKKLEQEEMENLINQLFSTSMPEIDPDGNPVLRVLSADDLKALF
jgi:DNA mismatch repair protein MutL